MESRFRASLGQFVALLDFIESKSQPPPRTPAILSERIVNIAVNNFRGLVGTIVPLIVLLPLWEKTNVPRKLLIMWLWMFWSYLIQPVAVPNTSLIPVFYLPMAGIRASAATCACYMNESIMLYVLSSWAIVMLNNSGVDKRIALWFISSGDTSQYSGGKLMFKASSAAFFLSMFSSRLITTLNLTELVTKACERADPSVPDVRNIRDAVNNAIQTSSAIGSIAILHSSYVTLLFRGCFHEFVKANKEWPDIFNYFTYSVFAFPVAFIMFIVNLIYHSILLNKVSGGLSEPQKKEIQAAFKINKTELPKEISLHEILSVLFQILLLLVLFFRWIPLFGDDFGWAKFSVRIPTLPRCKDATVLAMFVITLHTIPKSYGFLKIFTAHKRSELELKPESAILWWRFVDKNCNYGYLYTFGAAFSLITASRAVGLDLEVSSSFSALSDMDFNVGLFMAVVVAAFLCNLMTAMAACSMWLPFVLALSVDSAFPWPSKVYLAALGVGIASNFGFCTPFQYTPGYYCNRIGKVPVMTMIKYSIIPVLYCTIILYIALVVAAECIWDSSRTGFQPLSLPTTTKSTKATATTEGG